LSSIPSPQKNTSPGCRITGIQEQGNQSDSCLYLSHACNPQPGHPRMYSSMMSSRSWHSCSRHEAIGRDGCKLVPEELVRLPVGQPVALERLRPLAGQRAGWYWRSAGARLPVELAPQASGFPPRSRTRISSAICRKRSRTRDRTGNCMFIVY
jgi:hypothetical protein